MSSITVVDVNEEAKQEAVEEPTQIEEAKKEIEPTNEVADNPPVEEPKEEPKQEVKPKAKPKQGIHIQPIWFQPHRREAGGPDSARKASVPLGEDVERGGLTHQIWQNTFEALKMKQNSTWYSTESCCICWWKA